MAEAWSVYDEFSLILIENYIRFETAVKNLKSKENGNEAVSAAAKFKIAKEYYEQIKNGDYPEVLIGLELSYDEGSSILTVMPDEHFTAVYENAIMRDVALKQSDECKVRYSKFIKVIE